MTIYNVIVPDKEIVDTSDYKPFTCAYQIIVGWSG